MANLESWAPARANKQPPTTKRGNGQTRDTASAWFARYLSTRETRVNIRSYVNTRRKKTKRNKKQKNSDPKINERERETRDVPGVETAVDDSDVAVRQEGIVGRDATAERGKDGRIALNFVPQAEILKYTETERERES